MSELEDLKRRVAALEEMADSFAAALRKYAKSVTLQTDWTADTSAMAAKKEIGAALEPEDTTRELSDQLVAIFKKTTGVEYVFEGAKDALAVQRLLRLRLERRLLLARWEEAVTLKSYPGTRSIAIFATRVNEYGKAARAPIAAPPAGDPYAP